jgi:hypothetical protein
MINQKPIFVNSFARGGSNIVWEILQSHSEVVAPIEETDKIIWQSAGKWKPAVNIWLSLRSGHPLPQIEKYSKYWIFNYGVFHANNYGERRLNKFARNYLDNLLYYWKLKNIEHPFNKYKNKNEIYTIDELKGARVVAKHVNGLIYLVPDLMEMYPDSIHFGLVRNGLALCESRIRRGTFKDSGKFGAIYTKVAQKFLEYEQRYSNFYLLKFEDLLENPQKFIQNLYDKAGLKYESKIFVRLKAKKFVKNDGNYGTGFTEGSKYWVDVDKFFEFIDKDINLNQITQMSMKDKEAFLDVAKDSMERLGYIERTSL